MVTVKEIESYKNYGKVVSISNGVIEAYVTVDIGPRIIRFGYVGSQNFMHDGRDEFTALGDEVFQNYFGKGKEWENLGGHRIWTSPESYPETYYPDLDPVAYTVSSNGAIFTPPAETENGMQKILEVKMDPDDTNMQVVMTVKNICDKDLDFAIWGLSVCAKHGNLIIPMNDNDTGLLANRNMSIWPYTDLSNDRIYFGKRYVTVRQDVNMGPMKLGFDLNRGTAYYVLNDEVFCKHHDTNHPCGRYPDNNCSFETYTNQVFIEVESLSEQKVVKPNDKIELTESWSLCKKPCEVDFKSDDSIDNFLKKL